MVDVQKNPLPYLELFFEYDGKTYEATTDLNGNYEFNLGDLKIKEDEKGILYFTFSYVRDGKNYFQLYHYNTDDNNYRGSLIEEEEIELKENENKEVNLIFDGDADVTIATNLGSYLNIRDHSSIYFHMHEALEFALEALHVNLDHQLPIDVFIGQPDRETLYSPSSAYIKISKSDKSFGSSNRPRNREYHEFAHHLMYDIYEKWPQDRYLKNTRNHDGFLNPSTADSYIEGFAEFMALAIAKFHGYEDADEYAGYGSFEKNYKPWDKNGYYEEFSIGSLLWDMYDSNNEEGDSLTMSLNDIWRIISVKRANFYEYYKAFIERYPEKENAINDVFILHGFFVDTREGNKERDSFEPFRSSNDSRTYSKGDYFIDLSCTEDPCDIEYENGFKIGPAANYHRQNRTQAIMPEDSFLKVDPNGPRYYTISITYPNGEIPNEEYDIEMKQGLVFINPLPSDIEAIIRVKPKTEEFTYSQDFEIKNSELIQKVNQNTDKSFAEHDFEFERIAYNKDLVYAEEGFEPDYSNDDRKFQDTNENFEEVKINRNNKGFFSYLIWFLIFGGVIGISYHYFKKEDNRKNLSQLYNKKVVPKSKEIINYTKENTKKLVKKTKEIYHEKLVPKTKDMISYTKENTKKLVKKTKEIYYEKIIPKIDELRKNKK